MTPSERYKKAQIYFSKIESDVLIDIEKSIYKSSLKGLYHKTKILDQIKDGILKLDGYEYPSYILFRSLIEHYLLAYYFFLKPKIENSDNLGEDFYDAYANSEFFKQETYSLQLEDLRNKKVRVVDINVLKEIYPSLETLSQKELQSYHEVASQFGNLKKIGQYLIENKDFEPMMSKVNELTFDLLEKYNVLSSYVHGGPYAERHTLDSDKFNFKIKYAEVVDWAFTLTHMSKVYLILALRNEFFEKYSNHFREMYK